MVNYCNQEILGLAKSVYSVFNVVIHFTAFSEKGVRRGT